MKLRMTLLALLALGACKDKDKSTEGESAKPASAEAPATEAPKETAKPAAAGPLKIEALALTIDVPAGTKVSDMAGTQMVQAPGFAVSVDPAGLSAAETLAAEVEEAKSMYSGTNITQEEIEGGWHVTFENTGSMGTNYMVRSRLTIDGKPYTCSTTSSTKEQMAAALAACKTLKK